MTPLKIAEHGLYLGVLTERPLTVSVAMDAFQFLQGAFQPGQLDTRQFAANRLPSFLGRFAGRSCFSPELPNLQYSKTQPE